jgi:hypothetical protein
MTLWLEEQLRQGRRR